jgi:hypothetical protein
MSVHANYLSDAGLRREIGAQMDEKAALTELLGNALRMCAAREMQPPFVLCVIDADGNPFWLSADSTEVKFDGDIFPRNPRTILVLDRDHVQAKIVIT